MERKPVFQAGILLAILCITVCFMFGCQKKDRPIAWHANVPDAIRAAKAEDKPVLIEFGAVWCPHCQKMNEETFTDSTVIEKLKAFAAVQVDVDKDSVLADHYHANARKYGGVGIPNMLFVAPDGKEVKHVIGFRSPEQFVAILDSVIAEIR
jgi:thiol:disulfide interchange protein